MPNNTGEWTLTSVVFMSIWLTCVILVGVAGNILVIIVSLQGTRVRTRGKSLIASMAFADMLESLNMILMLITVTQYGEWIFGELVCTLHGFVTTQFVIASMYSLMTISINRYFIVVKSNHYKKIFSQRNLYLMITFIWIFPLIFAVPPLLGWSKYDFQSTKATCIFYFSTSVVYSVALMAFCVPIPLSIIVFCCYKIYKQVKQHRTQIEAIGTSKSANVEEIRITKTLIIIILAYLTCFIPASIVNFIEMINPSYKIPFWVDIITVNLVFANHANNPVIYGVFNRQYRRAFKELFIYLMPGMHYSISTDSTNQGYNHNTSAVRNRGAERTGWVENEPESCHPNALPKVSLQEQSQNPFVITSANY